MTYNMKSQTRSYSFHGLLNFLPISSVLHTHQKLTHYLIWARAWRCWGQYEQRRCSRRWLRPTGAHRGAPHRTRVREGALAQGGRRLGVGQCRCRWHDVGEPKMRYCDWEDSTRTGQSRGRGGGGAVRRGGARAAGGSGGRPCEICARLWAVWNGWFGSLQRQVKHGEGRWVGRW